MNKNPETFVPISLEEVRKFIELSISGEDSKLPYNEKRLKYSPEILAIIEEYISSGKYPYNRDIENLVHEKLFPDIPNEEVTRHFSGIVYNTQCYHHSVEDKKQAEEFAISMKENGFEQATNETLKYILENDVRCVVVLDGHNIFGTETKHQKTLRLRNWGNGQGLHWMDSRAKRKGFKAYEGQYVKII